MILLGKWSSLDTGKPLLGVVEAGAAVPGVVTCPAPPGCRGNRQTSGQVQYL